MTTLLRPAALLVLATAATAAGCSPGSPQACTVVCSDLGQCPDGTSCDTDGFCYAPDQDRTCAAMVPDGSIGQPDGPLTGDPDAAIDPPDGGGDRPDAGVGIDACVGPETFSAVDDEIVDIPDNSPAGISRVIEATGTCAVVQSVEVRLDITHTFRGDLEVSLTPPRGDAVVFIAPDPIDGLDDIHEVFEVDIPAGLDANGEWVLDVSDNSAADVGTLDRWSLGINRAAP